MAKKKQPPTRLRVKKRAVKQDKAKDRTLLDRLWHDRRSKRIKLHSKEAQEWMFDQAKKLSGKIRRRELLDDPDLKIKKAPLIGRMYMYVYDPKTKETLPYYDKFPLIIMVGPAKGGFYGLNLHYLDPFLRAQFLDTLIETYATRKKPATGTRMKISYESLKGLQKVKAFEPCFKHYLTSHVKSKMAEVNPADWRMVTLLPTAHFTKKPQKQIWADSRAQIFE